MNLKETLRIAPAIAACLRTGRPVVALESALLSRGMPYPDNLAFAAEIERIVRAEGAEPAAIAVLDGVLTVGLAGPALERLCRGDGVQKVSRRDLPVAVAVKGTGAPTVAATMILASLVGIRVLAACGIGGVLSGAQQAMDISADLQELGRTPVAVVCAGANMMYDTGLTLAYLETMGVPVLGLGTADFPAVYCRKSGFGVDYTAQTTAELAHILKAKWNLGLKGGVLIGNPAPEGCAMDFSVMRAVVDRGLAQAAAAGVRGTDITPFLLAHIATETGGKSLKIDMQLASNNARAAAGLAVAYASG